MYIGLGILLLVVGAILTFALHASVSGVDLALVGWILMAGGLLAIVLSLAMGSGRRTGGISSRRATTTDPGTGARVDEVRVDPDDRV